MDETSERVELLRGIFKSRYRLDIACVIGNLSIDPPEQFNAWQISLKANVGHSIVGPEIKFLERFGLIERLPIKDSTPAKWYIRRENPLWQGFSFMKQIIDAQYPPDTALPPEDTLPHEQEGD